MDVNSVRYSGIGGDCALELALKASVRCWEMVEDAPIVLDGKVYKCNISEKEVVDGKPSKHDIRLVARMQSPSSMHGDSGCVPERSSSDFQLFVQHALDRPHPYTLSSSEEGIWTF